MERRCGNDHVKYSQLVACPGSNLPHILGVRLRRDDSEVEHLLAKAASHGKETIVLVDGYGLIFRAYFALPASMSTTTGLSLIHI